MCLQEDTIVVVGSMKIFVQTGAQSLYSDIKVSIIYFWGVVRY